MELGGLLVYTVMYLIVICLIVVIYVLYFKDMPKVKEQAGQMRDQILGLSTVYDEALAKRDANVVAVASKIPVIQTKQTAYELELADLAVRGAAMSNSLSGNWAYTSNIRSNVDAHSKDLVDMKDFINGGTDKLYSTIDKMGGAVYDAFIGFGAKMGGMDAQLSNVGNRVVEHDISIASYGSNVRRIDSAQVRLVKQVDGVTKDLASLRGGYTGSIDVLQRSLDARVSKVATDIQAMDSLLGTRVSSLDARVSKVTTDMQVMDSLLGTRVSSLDARVSKNFTDAQAMDTLLGGRITNLEGTVTSRFANVDSRHATAVTGIEGRLTGLSLSNATLQARVNSLATSTASSTTASTSGTLNVTKINSVNGISVTAGDPGPLVEKSNGNPGDRYGIGQFPDGNTRMYSAKDWAAASINMSYARADGGFDDVVRVTRAGEQYKTNVKGSLCVEDVCMTKTQMQTVLAGSTAGSVATPTTATTAPAVQQSSTFTTVATFNNSANFAGAANFKGGKSAQNPNNWQTHLPWDGDGKNYIRGDTEMRGNTNNIGDLTVGGQTNLKGGNSVHNPNNWSTHFPWTADGKNYIRGETEIAGNTVNLGDLTVNNKISAKGNADFAKGLNVSGGELCIDGVCLTKADMQNLKADLNMRNMISVGDNGSTVLPGGVMIQWGTLDTKLNTPGEQYWNRYWKTVKFPKPFKKAFSGSATASHIGEVQLELVAHVSKLDSTAMVIGLARNPDKLPFNPSQLVNYPLNANTVFSIKWFAIGSI